MSLIEILKSGTIINKDSSEVEIESLSGKVLGIYFSAHWCGPCRSFTPSLAAKYNEIISNGHNFEIIFVSADEDEESALSYFADMPWKMLSFSDRDQESSLSKLYQVNGIPTLVLVDEDGATLTTEGREAIITCDFTKLKNFEQERILAEEKAKRELEELKTSFSIQSFFAADKIINGDGSTVPADTLKDKIIGLYFSAHWCPPCRGFTPVLSEKYKGILSDGGNFDIIFVSSDRDETSASEYFKEMPWKMLSYKERDMKKKLSEVFEIAGIPTLVLIAADGKTIITTEGREAIMMPFEKIPNFAEEKKKEEERLEKLISTFPDSVIHESHIHPLNKLPSIYRGQYGCDVCGSGGSGWVYHCDECGYDAHPLCVVIIPSDE